MPVPSSRKKNELTCLPQKHLLKQGWFYGIVLIVVIAIIVTAVWISSTRNRDIRSIAVLPVENLSGNTDEAWLEAGIHNGLIDEMVKIRELRLVPRRSTLKYAGTDMTIPEIANELEVDGIVETTFSKSGNNLNLQVRLIQAHPEERQLWNASYDRMIQNILTTYCDVAKAIAGEINISLSADEESRLSSTHSVDPDAYEAYWRGMFYLYKQSQSDLNTAMQYFETAVEIDPEFALAYLGIASFWIGEMQGGFLPYSEAAPKMEEAMDKALLLDSTSMEIHYRLSVINFYYLWEWDIAEREFLKTLELNPNYAWALAHYSHFLAAMGKPAEGLPYAEKATKLEKLDLTIHGVYGMALRYVHKPDETIKILEEDLAKFPGEMMTYSTLRSAYHDKHMYDEAIHAGIKYYEIRGDTACISALEQGYREEDYPLAMQRNAEALIEQSKTKYIPPWQVATLYTRAGMNEEALNWLEKAFEEHDPNMPYINADPIFDDLREDPRFREILRKMRLPE
jgi:TolB-like protein/Tfp pilus assembly protein PilF